MVDIRIFRTGDRITGCRLIDAFCQFGVGFDLRTAGCHGGIAHAGNVGHRVYEIFQLTHRNTVRVDTSFLCRYTDHTGHLTGGDFHVLICCEKQIGVTQSCTARNTDRLGTGIGKREPDLAGRTLRRFTDDTAQYADVVQIITLGEFEQSHLAGTVDVLQCLIILHGHCTDEQPFRTALRKLRLFACRLGIGCCVVRQHLTCHRFQTDAVDETDLRNVFQLRNITH